MLNTHNTTKRLHAAATQLVATALVMLMSMAVTRSVFAVEPTGEFNFDQQIGTVAPSTQQAELVEKVTDRELEQQVGGVTYYSGSCVSATNPGCSPTPVINTGVARGHSGGGYCGVLGCGTTAPAGIGQPLAVDYYCDTVTNQRYCNGNATATAAWTCRRGAGTPGTQTTVTRDIYLDNLIHAPSGRGPWPAAGCVSGNCI